MPIIPYRVSSEFAKRIDRVISESGLRAEVNTPVTNAQESVREITVSDNGAKVVLLVGGGDSSERSLVRMGFREGILHRLLYNDRSLDLAKRVETILRTAPESDIVAEIEWLVSDPTGPAAVRTRHSSR